MYVRNCLKCGNEFTAVRHTAKYCGATCRKRGERGTAVVHADTSSKQSKPVDDVPKIVADTREVLAAAGKLDHPLGDTALILARSLTEAGTQSGLAAASKELRAVLAELLGDVRPAADPVDELRARRDVKRSAAG